MTRVEQQAAVPSTATGWRTLPVVPALDGVRGLAVLLVVITHLQLLLPYEVTGIRWIDDAIEGSYLGVDLFFVLSGFLITALLLNEVSTTNNLRFGAFYIRRALRLLPALYVLLFAHAIYAWVADLSWFQEWATIRGAVLYVSNWQLVFRPLTGVPDLGLLWSLAIEEQFYLLWPAILITFFGPRQHVRTVVAALTIMILGVALWRAHLWQEGVFWAQLAIRTDTRVDALLVGALLASLWVRGVTPTRWVKDAGWVGLAVVVFCVATFDITTGEGYKGGLTIFALGVALVILALLDGTWGARRFFELRPLRAVGRVSYGLYLWHYPVFYAVSKHGADLSNGARLLVAFTITAAGTAGSWYLIERPALSLKGRFGSRRARTPIAAARTPAATALPARPLPSWATNQGKAFWAVGAGVGLTGLLALAEFTVLVDDPPGATGQPDGVEFPAGAVDREGYWSLVGLELGLKDSFDRDDHSGSLGTTDTGETWVAVAGEWGVRANAAAVVGDATASPLIAVAPQESADGLVEVTLGGGVYGAGLAFRYQDPDNYWSVTATDAGSWSVDQVIDGGRSSVGEFEAPVYSGVTISVTLNGPTVRFLVDGIEQFRVLDPPPDAELSAGLFARGSNAAVAQWDRYLLLASDPGE